MATMSSSSSSCFAAGGRRGGGVGTLPTRSAQSHVSKRASCNAGRTTRRANVAMCAQPAWRDELQAKDDEMRSEEAAVRDEVAARMEKLLAGGSESAGVGGDGSNGASVIGGLNIADLRTRIDFTLGEMESGLVERGTEVRLLLLSALCGEHLLLLGPPGTAKSELGRRLSLVCGTTYFERLLTRFSVPEELFGPVSLLGLEKDMYVRKTEGYLPEATVAFVDEIFKANSAILNSLLTILNERLFDNGAERLEVPLLCLVGASNELPESEELDALYDRFLFRKTVNQVSAQGLGELLSTPSIAAAGEHASAPRTAPEDTCPSNTLTTEDFASARQKAKETVEVPKEVVDLLVDLRVWLAESCEPPVYVSDRRLVKSVGMLRVAALTAGRTTVTPYDTLLLEHVLWAAPEDSSKIRKYLLERIAGDPGLDQSKYLLKGLFGRACRCVAGFAEDGEGGDDAGEAAALATEIGVVRNMVSSELETAQAALGARSSGSKSNAGGSAVLAGSPWFSREEAEDATQALAPVLKKSVAGQKELLEDIVTLEVALERKTGAHVLAMLMQGYWQDFIRGHA